VLCAVSAPLATEEEAAAAFPGGANNPLTGHDAWIECYAQLTAFGERRTMREAGREQARERIAEVVARSSARQPRPVALSIGDDYLVHPKAPYALAWLDTIDRIAAPLASHALSLVSLLESTDADDVAASRWAPLVHSKAMRTWAWILLSEGAELPFGDSGAIEPPEWTQSLLWPDFIAIYIEHRTLHADDVMAMMAATQSEPGEERSRLGMGGFYAGMALEIKIDAAHLIRRWSFPQSVAANFTAHEQQRIGEANAKRKAQRGDR